MTKLPLDKTCHLRRRAGERVMVCLVGAQPNQVSLAPDIAEALRRERVEAIIGGFHVSGMLGGSERARVLIARLMLADVLLRSDDRLGYF